ncbi:MAG: hypothetical protein ACXU8U_04990, partial [Asticcacaulis sp.]
LSLADARPGRLSGTYGQAFTLYDVRTGPHGLEAFALPFASSKVRVPRDCYALPGEDVGYVFADGDAATATESQYVVCGGGADQPHGPYLPQGPAIASDADGWPASETALIAGQPRYLAVPDGNCPPEFSLRSTHCAIPAIRYLETHPDVPELDLIAAKQAVQPGDRLSGDDIMQWVLKRKPNGFKADGRWFAKSMFTPVSGCYGIDGLRWHVGAVTGGFDITEKTLSRCGAPPAPVPAAVYEAYGEDYYILNCAWDRNGKDGGAGCVAQAGDYLRHEKRKSAIVVVLNQNARPGDHLYDGGYIAYDVARAEMKGDDVRLDRIDDDQTGGVSLSNCVASQTSDRQAKGFVIVRSLGVAWARAYRWMDCPVY